MFPPKFRKEGEKNVTEQQPFGVAYKVGEDGKSQEIWRTEGWYASEGLLSPDGRHLVRFGPLGRDGKNHTDLAIASYDRGKLLKEYQVRDLIKQPDTLELLMPGYMWRAGVQTKPNGFQEGCFHLVMADKTAYDFDHTTGGIITTLRDEGAKNWREIADEQKVMARKKGLALFDASSFRDTYNEYFEVSNAELSDGPVDGCYLGGRPWLAELRPKNELKHKAEISVAFPVVDDSRVEAQVAPQDLLSALELAFDHPFITKRFETGGATGLGLRTQGDRLQWDTPTLIQFLTKTKGAPPKEDELKDWASFVIKSGESEHASVYLNLRTKEILAEEASKWPREPFLIDAAGSPVEAKKAE